MYTIMYINTNLINSLLTNNIIQLYHVIFKYYISIIFKDIIICSICKTLYLYVSSVYTVMWHAIIMPSYMSKYLIYIYIYLVVCDSIASLLSPRICAHNFVLTAQNIRFRTIDTAQLLLVFHNS